MIGKLYHNMGSIMITLQELCQYLEGLLQASSFTDYCTNGVQIEGRAKIKKIATGVSASLSTIQEAVNSRCDALIVHHGIFWSKDSYVIKGVKREKIKLLLDNDISLLAYHLPLDASQTYGNNWTAAKEMGWKNLEPFGFYNGIPIGVKGSFKPQKREKFIQTLEKYYLHPAHTALGGKEIVSNAALISGGAHKNITEAIAEGVDCYVTGSFDEPIWHQAFEEKINFFAMGHANTERIGPIALGKHLKDHFGIKCEFIDIQNPF